MCLTHFLRSYIDEDDQLICSWGPFLVYITDSLDTYMIASEKAITQLSLCSASSLKATVHV